MSNATADENNRLNKWSWIGLLIVALVSTVLASFWFIRDRDYEPALALIAALVSLVSLFFSKGLKGLVFCLGIVLGAGLAYLLLFFIPEFGSPSVKTETKQVQVEKENLNKENENLKNQIAELENIKNSSETELSLRQQIKDLQTQIENLKQQNKEPDDKPNDNPAEPPNKPIKTLTVDNVLLEITSCKSISGNIEIELFVTNNGIDRDLSFKYWSSLTNEKGEKFKLDDGYSDNFINKVKRKLLFKFKQAGQSKSISVFELILNGESAQFRNIPVSQQ